MSVFTSMMNEVTESGLNAAALPPIDINSEYDPFHSPNDEEYEPVNFVMNDDDAERAIQKYKRAEERKNRCIAVAQNQIARLEECIKKANQDFERETWGILPQLDSYLDHVPAKETKTMKSFTLPAGKLVRKLPKEEFKKDDEGLLKYLEENEPEFVESVPKIKWGEFKKNLVLSNGVAVVKKTGVVLDCVQVVVHPASFEIR